MALAGLAFALGFGSEVLGVHTGFPFSDYAYTAALQPQLFDVPVLIPLAWAMMAYPAWRIGELIGNRPLTRAIAAAGALAAWDVALDPQMAGPKKPPIGRRALIATCATRAAARLRQA